MRAEWEGVAGANPEISVLGAPAQAANEEGGSQTGSRVDWLSGMVVTAPPGDHS